MHSPLNGDPHYSRNEKKMNTKNGSYVVFAAMVESSCRALEKKFPGV